MLNTFYNWTIPEPVVHEWYNRNGFESVVTLNRNEQHNCGWHVVGRKIDRKSGKASYLRTPSPISES
jgi:hypothetical protein